MDQILMLIVVCLLLLVLHTQFFFNEIENFNINIDVSNDDIKNLSQAIDDIVLCQNIDQQERCLKESRIRDFIEFRRSLGYNNFNLLIYLALIEKRVEKKTTLDKNDVFIVVKKFKPQTIADSFKKTSLSLAPDQTVGKFDRVVCKNALTAYIKASDQANIEFDAEYRKWKNTIKPNWQKALQDERNKLYAEYLKLPEASRGKFDDYYTKESKEFGKSPKEPTPPTYQQLQIVCNRCANYKLQNITDFPSLRDTANKCISNVDDEIAKAAADDAEAAAAAAALQKAKEAKEAADKLKAEQDYQALKDKNVYRTKVWAIGLGVGILLCFIAVIVIIVMVANKMKNEPQI